MLVMVELSTLAPQYTQIVCSTQTLSMVMFDDVR